MRYGPQVGERLMRLGMRIVAREEATAAGHITVGKFTFERGADKSVQGIVTALMNRNFDVRAVDARADEIERDILALADHLRAGKPDLRQAVLAAAARWTA